MFNIVNYPPGFGECTFCKLHDCGVSETGEQYWLHSNIELDKGGTIVIGYKCAKLMADNMNISIQVVEKHILLTPSDEQIGDYVRKAVTLQSQMDYMDGKHYEDHDTHVKLFKTNAIRAMDKSMLKEWFTERQIPFVPQWGEERLREEALKHV